MRFQLLANNLLYVDHYYIIPSIIYIEAEGIYQYISYVLILNFISFDNVLLFIACKKEP